MTVSSASKTAVVLAWTFSNEPQFFEELDRQYASWKFMPLRYRALVEARAVLPAERLLSPHEVVDAETRRSLYAEAIQRYNVFWRKILRWKREPWISCLQGYQIVPLFYALAFWLKFHAAVRGSGNARVFHLRPFSRIFLHGKVLQDVELLELVCSPPLPPSCWLRARGKRDALLGAICNHGARWLARTSRPLPGQAVDTLICGLQSTDWIAQAGYIQALQESGHRDFRWMIPEQDRLSKTEDEKLGLEGIERCQSCIDRFPLNEHGYLDNASWRHSSFTLWSSIHVLQRVRQGVRAALPESCFAPFHEWMSVFIERLHPGLRLKYESVERCLSAYAPRRIIANHTMEQLSFLRAWARHHGRTYIRLPHGVEAHLDAEYFWDADQTGTLGSFARERLLSNRSAAGTLSLVGGMHLAQQGQRLKARLRETRETFHGRPRRVLFMMGGYWAYGMPDMPEEVRVDLRALGLALKPLGAELAVRCHPRHIDAVSYRQIVTELGEEGLRISWSDARCSLTEDLRASCAAISATWNGSALMCLYGDIPLIGWMPRPAYAEIEAALAHWPLRATDAAQVADWVGRLPEDIAFADDVCARQRACLESFVYKPWDAPYAQAVALYANGVETGKAVHA